MKQIVKRRPQAAAEMKTFAAVLAPHGNVSESDTLDQKVSEHSTSDPSLHLRSLPSTCDRSPPDTTPLHLRPLPST